MIQRRLRQEKAQWLIDNGINTPRMARRKAEWHYPQNVARRRVIAAHVVLLGLSFYVVGVLLPTLATFTDTSDHLSRFTALHYVGLAALLYLLSLVFGVASRRAVGWER